ncbi:hypothetical protein [Shivajiella indica]|uniref:Uncharacterized protein n=1 Tax=Shivajiella indica TaxID=872115 RepID=A0ABW5BA72_9BACT
MRIILIVVLSIFLLVSCRGIFPNFQDDDFLSEKPQPSWRKNMYTFPKELQGLWVNVIKYDNEKEFEIDSTWIDQKNYIKFKYSSMVLLKDELEKDDVHWEIQEGKLFVIQEEDTTTFENGPNLSFLIDTEGNLTVKSKESSELLTLNQDVFLRKVNKNTYALNYKHPEGRGWDIFLIQAEEFQ